MAKLLIDGNTGDKKQPGAIMIEGDPQEVLTAIVIAMYASPAVAALIKNAAISYEQAKRQIEGNPASDINISLDDNAKKEFERIYGGKKS